MRYVLLIAAALLATPARAEVTVHLDDATQSAIIQMPNMMGTCIASMVLKGDNQPCQQAYSIMNTVATKIRSVPPVAPEVKGESK